MTDHHMTAEIELLPLPEGYDKYSPPRLYGGQMFHEGQMRAYARANSARAIAPLQAEIEALRAEALRELEEREQRDEALLRQALEALEVYAEYDPEGGGVADNAITALRERLGEKERAMTDRYERIRAALGMNLTPGPWTVANTNNGMFIKSLSVPGYLAEVRHCRTTQDHKADAAFIAVCDPDTIRALLDEREALGAENARLREDAERMRRALMWLASGDSGMSSKAICYHMLGMKSDGMFPLDPSDLGRCLRLLELFPEWKPRIGEMARYSPYWAALVERWDELAEMMADEVGIDWSKGVQAPRTYAAMKDALAALEAAREQQKE